MHQGFVPTPRVNTELGTYYYWEHTRKLFSAFHSAAVNFLVSGVSRSGTSVGESVLGLSLSVFVGAVEPGAGVGAAGAGAAVVSVFGAVVGSTTVAVGAGASAVTTAVVGGTGTAPGSGFGGSEDIVGLVIVAVVGAEGEGAGTGWAAVVVGVGWSGAAMGES